MKNEIQILENISHPNIVRIYEIVHDDSNYYIISELMYLGDLYVYANDRTASE